jgi:hypothetical protein
VTTDQPEYITLYEPPSGVGLAALLGVKPRTALLARRTETDNGTPYYRPVMQGTLADVAMLVEQLAEVERRGQLGAMEPDPPEQDPDATPGGRREPQPIPLEKVRVWFWLFV